MQYCLAADGHQGCPQLLVHDHEGHHFSGRPEAHLYWATPHKSHLHDGIQGTLRCTRLPELCYAECESRFVAETLFVKRLCRGRTSGKTSENILVALAASSHGSLSRHAQRAQWPSSASRGSLGVAVSAQIRTRQDKCEVCCRTSNLWQPVPTIGQSDIMLDDRALIKHLSCQCQCP